MSGGKTDRITFTLGVLRVITTAFLIGYSLKLSKLFFLFKFVIFFLQRFISWKKSKKHYYLVEYCYFAGLIVAIFTMLSLRYKIPDWIFVSVFGLVYGPLAYGSFMTRDRLYFHSPVHMGTVFLHINPVLLIWKMRQEEFNNIFSLKEVFLMNVRYTMPIYLIWLSCYYIFIFLIKRDKVYSKEYSSIFKDHSTNSKSPLYKYFGNNRILNEFIFVGSHMFLSSICILASSCFYVSSVISAILPIITIILTVWNASCKFCNALDALDK